ncbi:MAG: phosphatase PAP2 family protein [Rikenellaceae bacterium]
MKIMYENILSCDIAIFKCLNGNLGGFVDALMVMLSSKITLVATILVTLIALFKRLNRREFVYTFVGVLLIVLVADQTCNFFKDYFPRLRPMHEPVLEGFIYLVDGVRGGISGTVSAHAANSFGTLVFLSLIVKKRWYMISVIILAALISYSRIYLGFHYLLDVTYGTILGFTVAFGFKCIMGKLLKKVSQY